MSELGKKIIELRNIGYSYNKIMKELNCSKSTISYYLGNGQKEKTSQRRKKFSSKPESVLKIKIYRFNQSSKTNRKIKNKVRDFQRRNGSKLKPNQEFNFSYEDFLKKIGDDPKCYISGEKINLSESNSYSIDHIIPVSKGGKNTIENAGLVSSLINQMKFNITYDVLIEKCIQILEYNGYEVKKT
jgi:transposase